MKNLFTIILCLGFLSKISANEILQNNRITPTVKAVAKALPSVVNISTERIVSYSNSKYGAFDPFEKLFRNFYNRQRGKKVKSLGSGAVINKYGLIVTNSHVVHKATRIFVTDYNGNQYIAKEIAADDLNDLSLLRLVSKKKANLIPISFAQHNPILLGETVIAVGNPYGLGSSITKGIVSAIGRKVTFKNKVLFDDLIQTDAPINPGNSGGALININGELIGLNTAIYEQANSIGFAIPLKRIEKVLALWLIPERFADVSLGLIPGEVLINGKIVYICREIIPESPAAKAGIKKNDIITTVKGQKIQHLMDISNSLWNLRGGDTIDLTIKGKGAFNLTVQKIEYTDGNKLLKQKLDISAIPLTKQLAAQLKYPFYDGLVVTEVSKKNINLKRGDVIIKIGDVPIYDFSDVRRALNGKYYGDKINAMIIYAVRKFGETQLYKKNITLNIF
jgi:S1-C subfamily serine protease